jgi:hypothetical protein
MERQKDGDDNQGVYGLIAERLAVHAKRAAVWPGVLKGVVVSNTTPRPSPWHR